MAQSVRYTPGHTCRVCCIQLESKIQGHPSLDRGSWRSYEAAGQLIWCCVRPAFCWASRMLSGHIVGEWGGLVFWLWGSKCQIEGMSFLLETVPIFPLSGLEEAFLVTLCPASVHQIWETGLSVSGVVVWPRAQVDVCASSFSVDVMAQPSGLL